MNLFKNMEQHSNKVTDLPGFAELTEAARSEVTRVYNETFCNLQGRLGISIAQGMALEAAKSLMAEGDLNEALRPDEVTAKKNGYVFHYKSSYKNVGAHPKAGGKSKVYLHKGTGHTLTSFDDGSWEHQPTSESGRRKTNSRLTPDLDAHLKSLHESFDADEVSKADDRRNQARKLAKRDTDTPPKMNASAPAQTPSARLNKVGKDRCPKCKHFGYTVCGHDENGDLPSSMRESELDEKHIGFARLKGELEAKGNSAESAGAIAHSIGVKKYGAKAMNKAAHTHEPLGEDENSTCRDCKKSVPALEVFPGPRCLNCHAKKVDGSPLQKPNFAKTINKNVVSSLIKRSMREAEEATRTPVWHIPGNGNHELFYGSGGHGGPYPSHEAAARRAAALLKGNRSEKSIKIHPYSATGVGGYGEPVGVVKKNDDGEIHHYKWNHGPVDGSKRKLSEGSRAEEFQAKEDAMVGVTEEEASWHDTKAYGYREHPAHKALSKAGFRLRWSNHDDDGNNMHVYRKGVTDMHAKSTPQETGAHDITTHWSSTNAFKPSWKHIETPKGHVFGRDKFPETNGKGHASLKAHLASHPLAEDTENPNDGNSAAVQKRDVEKGEADEAKYCPLCGTLHDSNSQCGMNSSAKLGSDILARNVEIKRTDDTSDPAISSSAKYLSRAARLMATGQLDNADMTDEIKEGEDEDSFRAAHQAKMKAFDNQWSQLAASDMLRERGYRKNNKVYHTEFHHKAGHQVNLHPTKGFAAGKSNSPTTLLPIRGKSIADLRDHLNSVHGAKSESAEFVSAAVNYISISEVKQSHDQTHYDMHTALGDKGFRMHGSVSNHGLTTSDYSKHGDGDYPHISVTRGQKDTKFHPIWASSDQSRHNDHLTTGDKSVKGLRTHLAGLKESLDEAHRFEFHDVGNEVAVSHPAYGHVISIGSKTHTLPSVQRAPKAVVNGAIDVYNKTYGKRHKLVEDDSADIQKKNHIEKCDDCGKMHATDEPCPDSIDGSKIDSSEGGSGDILKKNHKDKGESEGLKESEGLHASIGHGDRVTILTPHGSKLSGRAVMKGPAGWVLNLGGKHGTPGIASAHNTIAVRKRKVSESVAALEEAFQEFCEGVEEHDKLKDHTKNPYHEILSKHGFVHKSTSHEQNRLSGNNPRYDHTVHRYEHPEHGRSSVTVDQEHDPTVGHGGQKVKGHSFLHRHEQSNGIMSPGTGDSKVQLHRDLSYHYGVPKGMDAPKLTASEIKYAHIRPTYKMNEAVAPVSVLQANIKQAVLKLASETDNKKSEALSKYIIGMRRLVADHAKLSEGKAAHETEGELEKRLEQAKYEHRQNVRLHIKTFMDPKGNAPIYKQGMKDTSKGIDRLELAVKASKANVGKKPNLPEEEIREKEEAPSTYHAVLGRHGFSHSSTDPEYYSTYNHPNGSHVVTSGSSGNWEHKGKNKSLVATRGDSPATLERHLKARESQAKSKRSASSKADLMRSLGLNKVKGSVSGKTYWE